MEQSDKKVPAGLPGPYGTFPHITNASQDKRCYHGKPEDYQRNKKAFKLKKALKLD
jgi:hypothetical protein